MTSFSRPAAAISTILARSTSRYGDVYLRALDSSSRRCSPDSLIVYGLSLGILSTTSAAGSVAERSPKSTVRIRHRICDRLYLASSNSLDGVTVMTGQDGTCVR